MPALMRVALSRGVEQLLSLDDIGVRESYGDGGVTVEYSKSRIIVSGTRSAIEALRGHLRAAKYYCGETWYRRSAIAALATVNKALGNA